MPGEYEHPDMDVIRFRGSSSLKEYRRQSFISAQLLGDDADAQQFVAGLREAEEARQRGHWRNNAKARSQSCHKPTTTTTHDPSEPANIEGQI